MLIGATAPIIFLLFALLQGATHESLTLADFALPAGLVAGSLAVHMAVRFLAPDADPALLPIVALLSSFGIAFVTRLDPSLGASQTRWVAVGSLALVGTLAGIRTLERLARYKYTIALAGIALILSPALFGVEVNGAKLWLHVAGQSFQPAEVAKILIVVFLAAYLAEHREVLTVSTKRSMGVWLPSARHLGPLLLMWALSLVLLVSEKDLGTSLLFFGTFLIMLYVATGQPGYVASGLVLFGIGATGAYVAFSHVQDRIAIWLTPFADPTGKGYQLVQSLFALAAGGLSGAGIGKGLPTRIPYAATDFIFTAIAEELGLLGAAALIAAYLVLCLRGLAAATRARSDMASLVSIGLVTTLGLQVFVIVGGVTRLIPLTGITLPFVSYGGSSILANFILLGLLLRASEPRTTSDPTEEETAEPTHLGRHALMRRTRIAGISLAILLGALVLNLTYIQAYCSAHSC